MTNKYLEKIAEYTDKQHAKRHMFSGFGLASKEMRKRESVGGFLRTQGRAVLEATGGGYAGGAVGAGIGHLAGRRAAIGGVAGFTAGTLGGAYHGTLASIRNRIHEGKLKDVKDTSKK
jgi:hypothetical protein